MKTLGRMKHFKIALGIKSLPQLPLSSLVSPSVRLSFLSPPFPYPLLSLVLFPFPSLHLEVGPLNTAKGSGGAL